MNDESPRPLNAESSSVHAYLNMLQTAIGRMSNHSASCKTWCVTLIAAVLAVSIPAKEPLMLWIGLGVSLMLYFLDSYYLALERDFRDIYIGFVENLHQGNAKCIDLFAMKPPSMECGRLCSGMRSYSTWPFYVLLIVVGGLFGFLVNTATKSDETPDVPAVHQTNQDDTNQDETKKDETKKDETKKDETKKDETKQDETQMD